MDILKKHYEKVVLGLFLLALLGFSINMLSGLKSVREMPSDGPPPPGAGELTVERLQTDDFRAQELVENPDVDWAVQKTGRRESLFFPGNFMVCANEECNHWLPFDAQDCPWCGVSQQVGDGPTVTDPETDSDQDGILDAVEEQYAFLNPDNPEDAQRDQDEDWFTNLEEVGVDADPPTDPEDPADHPLLARNLRLLNVQEQPFDIAFQNLIVGAEDNPKEKWDIVLKVISDGVWRTRFTALGETVKGYKLVDVEHKIETTFDRRVNDEVETDVSEVILEKDGQRMTLQIGRESLAGVRIQVVFYQSAHDRRQAVVKTVSADETLVLEGAAGDEEEYKLSVLSENRVRATLITDEERSVVVDRSLPEKLRERLNRPRDLEEPDFGPGLEFR